MAVRVRPRATATVAMIPVAAAIVTSVLPVHDGNAGDAASYAPSVVVVDNRPSRPPRFPAVPVPYVTDAPSQIPPRSPRSKCRVTAVVEVPATALAVATAIAPAYSAVAMPSGTAVADVQPRPRIECGPDSCRGHCGPGPSRGRCQPGPLLALAGCRARETLA